MERGPQGRGVIRQARPALGAMEALMRRPGFAAAVTVVMAAAAPLGQTPAAPDKAARASARGGTLAALAADLAAGRLVVIDLTQMLNESTPIIQLPPPF